MFKKILFLDIDGVLNNYSPYFKYGEAKSKDEYYKEIYPELIEILNRIVKETDCKIVISSSWRIIFSVEEITAMFKIRNFNGEIIDSTPILWKERGLEIQEWLNNNKTEKFAIVDDDTDMAHLYSFLFKTEMKDGLTNEIANSIIK